MTSFGQCRKQWKCRRCSSYGVVDVSVIMQRQVSGFSPGRWSMSPVVQVVVWGVWCHRSWRRNHRSDSAVEQIVASRAADHGEFVMVRVGVADAVLAVMDVSVIMQ